LHSIEQITLSKKFKSTINIYPRNKLKYIHYKTVEHFICHFDQLPFSQKAKVSEVLTNYINLIDESSIINNGNEARELFQNYLERLTDIYHLYLNFHVTIKPLTVLWFTLPLFLFLYLLKATGVYYFALAGIIIIVIIRHFYYERKKNSYSILY
jgi:hypothetical protein